MSTSKYYRCTLRQLIRVASAGSGHCWCGLLFKRGLMGLLGLWLINKHSIHIIADSTLTRKMQWRQNADVFLGGSHLVRLGC